MTYMNKKLFMKTSALRNLCNQENILLIFDKIQTGMGRTGRLFCYEYYDIEPDIMTLGKGIEKSIWLMPPLVINENDIEKLIIVLKNNLARKSEHKNHTRSS